MSVWYRVEDQECVNLSEDGEFLELMVEPDAFGNVYYQIPVELVAEALSFACTESCTADE